MLYEGPEVSLPFLTNLCVTPIPGTVDTPSLQERIQARPDPTEVPSPPWKGRGALAAGLVVQERGLQAVSVLHSEGLGIIYPMIIRTMGQMLR